MTALENLEIIKALADDTKIVINDVLATSTMYCSPHLFVIERDLTCFMLGAITLVLLQFLFTVSTVR